MNYELFYLIGESREPEIEKIKKEVWEIVQQEGAVWEEPEIYQRHKLAYKIKGESRGIYFARRFKLPPDKDKSSLIEKISRQLKLKPEILRFIIVNTEELPELKMPKSKEEKEITETAAPAKEAPKAALKEKTKTKTLEEALEKILNE